MAGNVWLTDSLGGYMNNPELDSELRFQAQTIQKFRQFCDIKLEYGKNKDENWNFDKVSNISTEGTALTETNTIPEHNLVITQGTGTVTEYGNAITYTGKLEALAKWDPKNPFQRKLRDDMAVVIDKTVEAQFDACKMRVNNTTSGSALQWSTSGTASGSCGGNVTQANLEDIVDYMLGTLLIPFYDGENYMCIATVKHIRGIYDALEAVWKYTEFPTNGEVGKYYKCRFVRETNSMNNAIGTSDCSGEAYYFGSDSVMEAVVIPEEIRAKIPTDYGRSKGLAWYFLGGWKIVWSGDPDNRIVKWDSTT